MLLIRGRVMAIVREVPQVPEALQRAISTGELTEVQLRELIELEANALSLSTEEAIKRAKAGTLPRHYIADDLALLVDLLQSARSA
jgi:hypothetical protein